MGVLQTQIELLHPQNDALMGQVADLKGELSRSVAVDSHRVRDFVLTAFVTPSSHEEISELLAAAGGHKYRLSAGKISQLSSYYRTVAGLILLDERVASLFVTTLADEIFFCKAPVLVVTEFYSTAIGAIELSESRDGSSPFCQRFRGAVFGRNGMVEDLIWDGAVVSARGKREDLQQR